MPLLPLLAAVLVFRAAAADVDPILREQELRVPDSSILLRAAGPGPGAERLRALRAMGRIQSPAYADALIAALADPDPLLRTEAAFDLGQVGGVIGRTGLQGEKADGALSRTKAATALVLALDAKDPRERAIVVEALGKTGGTGVEGLLAGLLKDSHPGVRGEAALGLFRLRFLKRIPELSASSVDALTRAFRDSDPEVRWRAVYAFSRWPEPRAKKALAAAALDGHLWVRLFALRALGQFKKDAPLEPLLKAQKSRDAAVRREAVAALGAGGWARRLDDSVFQDPSAHVRAAAVAAAGASGDRKFSERIEIGAAAPEASALVRGETFLALPKLSSDARPALEEGRASPHGWIRSRAYLALAELAGTRAVLMEGLKDPDPQVAAAALEGIAKSTEPWADAALEKVLADPQSSMELRGTAAEAAAGRGASLHQALYAAYLNSSGREFAELRSSIRKSIAAIQGQPGFKGMRYQLDAAENGFTPSPHLYEKPGPAGVLLETEKGDITISVAVSEAPVHAATFLNSVRAKLYDGSTWHRVVSNFVVQGGDPRGTGWGDAGFTLRDEVNRLRFERGAVGMPKAGKDTGGCQLFITLVPTPHLDGRYTVFGRVVAGMDAVDRLEPGDRIIKARVVHAVE